MTCYLRWQASGIWLDQRCFMAHWLLIGAACLSRCCLCCCCCCCCCGVLQPDINPGDQLEAVAAGLAAGVQDSSQQEVFADVAAAAARAVGMAF